MKKSSKVFWGLVLLVWALAFTGCGNGSTSGGDSNAFSGTWTGTAIAVTQAGIPQEGSATFTCSGSNWTLSFPAANINESGTIVPLSAITFSANQGGISIGGGALQGNALIANFRFGGVSVSFDYFTKR